MDMEDFEGEVIQALECINSGAWLKLEGSVGRWCNDFINSGIIIKDQELTKKKGPVIFKDGYGRERAQYRFKIDYDRLDDVYWETY